MTISPRSAMRPDYLLVAAVAALVACVSPAMSQTPSVPNTAPKTAAWDQAFLPPAPTWNGASKALLRDASDPWVTAFEADAEHDFSPNYVDTRAWFDRLDAASDLIRIEQFGLSPEGRPIYAIMASKDGAFGYEMEIITYPGSGVEKIEDLKGKKLAFTAETSNSGFKAPSALLKSEYKLEAGKDFEPVFSGKHDNSVLGVANKDYPAAAVANSVMKRMIAFDF